MLKVPGFTICPDPGLKKYASTVFSTEYMYSWFLSQYNIKDDIVDEAMEMLEGSFNGLWGKK